MSSKTNKNNNFQKPFLKWAGGKTQIIKFIIDKFPSKINNYYEIFLGGGSVLFALLDLQKQNKIIIKKDIYAFDINDRLIELYKHIQNESTRFLLYSNIKHYFNSYNNIEKEPITINLEDETETETIDTKEKYFYYIRNEFNKLKKNKYDFNNGLNLKCSAMFYFLNKTCFRGLYREGPKGFNVPYGHYKKTPEHISLIEINKISELIKNVNFICLDFQESIKKIKKNDFVYLDPPYYPISDKSFVNYTRNGFNKESHTLLFKKINDLNKKNILFVLSNSNTDFVLKSFKDYKTEEILAKRSINSKKPDSKTKELIIYN